MKEEGDKDGALELRMHRLYLRGINSLTHETNIVRCSIAHQIVNMRLCSKVEVRWGRRERKEGGRHTLNTLAVPYMASLSLNASVSHVGKIDIRSTTFKGVVMNLTHMKMYGNKYIAWGLAVFFYTTMYFLYLFPYISDVVDLDVEFDKIYNKMTMYGNKHIHSRI